MENKKSVLGRGLSALFASAEESNDLLIKDGVLPSGVLEVELSKIVRDQNQPRKTFNEASLQELCDSIKSVGIIQPIVLRQVDANKYVIVAGERRFRACQLAGLEKIPAIVKDITERQQREIALIENLQREDLNAIEEAKAMKALLDEYNISQTELASILGKSRPAITNTLRLLSLNLDVMELVREGRLSAGHARCLVSISDESTQKSYAQACCDNKMSVRELEVMVNRYLNPTEKAQTVAVENQSSDLKEFVHSLQRTFATKVKIIGNESKGRIFIDYYTKDDLQRIYDLLNTLKD